LGAVLVETVVNLASIDQIVALAPVEIQPISFAANLAISEAVGLGFGDAISAHIAARLVSLNGHIRIRR
jgi:hypothetical protein